MTEPTTTNIALIIPQTGDLVGSWGTTAVNVNMTALDGILGGTVTFSLSSATTVALTVPAGSITPGAGPNQSQNACIFLTGTLTGNSTIQLTLPGRYMVHNKCVVGTNSVKFAPASGGGNSIGLPPGEKITVFYDGTNVDYVDFGRVGSYLDLAVATTPAWITASTVPPYLNCDGSTISTTTYPQLFAMLGTTTLPDSKGRYRATLNQGSGRITSAVGGIDGNTLRASGGTAAVTIGAANVPALPVTIVDPGHLHAYGANNPAQGPGSGVPNGSNQVTGNFTTNTMTAVTGISAVANSASLNTPINLPPPTYMGGITLIRAG